MLQRLVEMLNGEAFRPDVVNINAAFSERFRGKATAAFSISMTRVKAVTITFDRLGRPSFSQPKYLVRGEDNDAIAAFVSGYARSAKADAVGVLVSYGWFAEMIDNSFRGSDIERNRILREEPREIIMQASTPGMSYAVVAHPTFNKSVMFTFQQKSIEQALEPFEKAGLAVARVQSGCFSLLNYIVRERQKQCSGRDLLIVDENGVFLLAENSGDWLAVASRADASAGTPEEVLPTILERRANQEKPLALVSTLGARFEERLKGMAGVPASLDVSNVFPEADGVIATAPEFLALVTD